MISGGTSKRTPWDCGDVPPYLSLLLEGCELMVFVAVQSLRQRQAVRHAGYERELHHVPRPTAAATTAETHVSVCETQKQRREPGADYQGAAVLCSNDLPSLCWQLAHMREVSALVQPDRSLQNNDTAR